MFTFIVTELEKLKAKFATEKGLCRAIKREFNREIERRQKEAKDMKAVAADIQQLEPEKTAKDFTIGILTLIQNDMEYMLHALHQILRLYIDLMADVRMKLIEELPRDEGLPESARALVQHDINALLKAIERNINDLISNIEGMASLSIQPQRMLERESQYREIIAAAIKARGDLTKWSQAKKTASKNLAAFERERFEMTATGKKPRQAFDPKEQKAFDTLFNENSDKSIVGAMKLILQELEDLTRRIITTLQESYEDFIRVCDSEDWKGHKLEDIKDADMKRPVSAKVIEMPRNGGAGGFGIPPAEKSRIDRKIEDVKQTYTSKLHLIESEARQLLSAAMHLE